MLAAKKCSFVGQAAKLRQVDAGLLPLPEPDSLASGSRRRRGDCQHQDGRRGPLDGPAVALAPAQERAGSPSR